MQGIQFSVVVTEGRPDGTGLTMANALSKMKVPCTIVLDSAVAFALEALKYVTPASLLGSIVKQLGLSCCMRRESTRVGHSHTIARLYVYAACSKMGRQCVLCAIAC